MVNLRGTFCNDLWNETLTEILRVNMLEVITIKIAKKKEGYSYFLCGCLDMSSTVVQGTQSILLSTNQTTFIALHLQCSEKKKNKRPSLVQYVIESESQQTPMGHQVLIS